ncbi:MAG: hypothetical protein ACK4M7_03970 [Burkholderiales bacterium]|jgi:hypothetical protein
MKKLLALLSALSLGSFCYADRILNFNIDNDIITCDNGRYTLSKNSTEKEIDAHCHVIGASPHKGHFMLPSLVFNADNKVKVKCHFIKGKVDKCMLLSH